MWALHNSLKGWTLYSLTDREVQLVINTLSSNEVKLVKVSKKGGSEWHKVSREQFPELYAPVGKFEEGYPALGSDAGGEHTSTDTDYFVVKAKKVMHPRLHERIEKAFNVTLLGQNNNFETTTIDLSEGGIHFTDIIPSWVSGYFIVRIEDRGQVYQVMCSLVEDQKEKKRVQVMSEESDPQFLKYRDWLDSLR